MPIDLVVTIRLGTRQRTLSLPELAAALGLDVGGTRDGILAAVLSRTNDPAESSLPGCPQGEGGYRGRGFPSDRNGNGIQDSRSSEPFREEGGPGEEGSRAVDIHAALASYLAERLGDSAKNAAWYRLVVSRVPRSVIDAALVRALDVPPAQIRKTRAAIFTALVRHHVRPRSSTSPDSTS